MGGQKCNTWNEKSRSVLEQYTKLMFKQSYNYYRLGIDLIHTILLNLQNMSKV